MNCLTCLQWGEIVKRFSISLCICLATYQTASLVYTYFQNETRMAIYDDVDDDEMVMTVCVKSQSRYIVKPLDQIPKATLNKMKQVSADCNWENMTLFCLSLLNENERYSLGIPLEEFFSGGFINAKPKNIFNTLFYGNCATRCQSLEDPNGKVDLRHMQMSFKYYNLLKDEVLQLTIVIHNRDVAPAFNRDSLTYTWINNKIQTEYHAFSTKAQQKEVECIERKINAKEAWPLLKIAAAGYDVNEKDDVVTIPLNYSREMCLDQCLFDLVKRHCKCIMPKLMLYPNDEALPICDQRCRKIPEGDVDVLCHCMLPCKSTHYKIVKDITSYPMEKSEAVHNGAASCARKVTAEGSHLQNYIVSSF